jgi:nucleotide-binding universal stress UspA family protein
MRILLAVDGSKHSLNAVQFLIDHYGAWLREKPELDLVTVHLPVPRLPGMGAAVGKAQLDKYYQEESERSLADARKKLDAAGVRYEVHTLVGAVAESLVKHAKDKRCDLICIGTRGHSELGKVLVGSTATKVMHISDVPVLLVK